MKRIGFVGLGVMGGPMAGHLVSAGFDVVVWNRTASKADAVVAQGAHLAGSMADLGEACDVVMLCVTRSEDVESCLAELTSRARPRTIFVDHSTIAPGVAVRLHQELESKGFRFVDAPITGGSVGAQKGQLTIFCGGEDSTIEEIGPYVAAYGKRVARVGGAGSGQMMKMANQIAVGGALLALCESLAFASKAGLDLAQTREMLAGGAAGSWAFDNYGPRILAGDWTPGFSITNQRKDFAYCRGAAKAIDADIRGTLLVDSMLEEMQRAGRGELTTAALFELLKESSFKQ